MTKYVIANDRHEARERFSCGFYVTDVQAARDIAAERDHRVFAVEETIVFLDVTDE